MADFKIVVIKDGKPTNLTSGDAAEAPSLTDGTTVISGGTITGSSSITATTLTDGTASINLGAISGATTITATGAVEGGSLTDGTATISAGSLTGGVAATFSGAVEGGSLTDGTATISAGSLTGGVAATFSGAVEGGSLTDGTATITGGAVSGVTTLTTTGDVTIGGNAGVSGDLTVQGDIISRGSVDIVVEDQFLELGNNNVSTTPFAGGYVQVNAKAGDLVFVAESFTNPDTIQLTEEGDASPTYKTASIQITTLLANGGVPANSPSFGIDDKDGNPVTFTFATDFSGATIAEQADALATAINGNAAFRAVSDEVDTVIIQYPAAQSGGAGAIVFNLNGGSGAATTQNFGGNPQLPAGTVFMVSGLTDNAGNNGLYVVATTGQNGNNGTITIDTTPANAVQWCQNDLATATEEGSVTLVQLYVQAVSDGVITDSSSSAIAQGVLADSFQTFASEANFTDGYAVVGASAVTTTLQNAYDNGSQINNTNTGTPFQVSGAGTITLDSDATGQVQNVGDLTQSGSINIKTGDDGINPAGSISILSENDMAISMITDLSAEATLTIGAYTPAGANQNSSNSLVLKGDEVSTVVRFNAGAAISASDTLAFGTMVTQSTLTVTAQPADGESIELIIGANSYTVNFSNAASEVSFTGGVANIDRSTSNNQIAADLATLFNSITDINGTSATNVATLAVDLGVAANEFDMTLSARSYVDSTAGSVIEWTPTEQEAVVVPANNDVTGFGYYFAGVNRDTVGGAAIGETVEVEISGTVSCDTTNATGTFLSGTPVYMNGGANSGFITPTATSTSGEVVFQVGILLQYDSGSNSATVLLQPQFIAEIA